MLLDLLTTLHYNLLARRQEKRLLHKPVLFQHLLREDIYVNLKATNIRLEDEVSHAQ